MPIFIYACAESDRAVDTLAGVCVCVRVEQTPDAHLFSTIKNQVIQSFWRSKLARSAHAKRIYANGSCSKLLILSVFLIFAYT